MHILATYEYTDIVIPYQIIVECECNIISRANAMYITII